MSNLGAKPRGYAAGSSSHSPHATCIHHIQAILGIFVSYFLVVRLLCPDLVKAVSYDYRMPLQLKELAGILQYGSF